MSWSTRWTAEVASNLRLQGKTAIITGAGTGIGRAVARRFAEEGARLVLNGRRLEPLLGTRDLLSDLDAPVAVVPGDVSVASECRKLVAAACEAWETVDILVNNAAVDREEAFLDMTEESWEEVIRINLKGPFLLSQQAARVMASGAGGAIVHVSSIDHFAANGLYSSYNVSKNGLMGLSRCMAVELARHHIRSNVVSPGATDTEMIARAAGPGHMGYMRSGFERVPMRRLIEPREIAQACLFLASEESSGMTGAEIVVDGGAMADMYMFETIPTSTPPPTSAIS